VQIDASHRDAHTSKISKDHEAAETPAIDEGTPSRNAGECNVDKGRGSVESEVDGSDQSHNDAARKASTVACASARASSAERTNSSLQLSNVPIALLVA